MFKSVVQVYSHAAWAKTERLPGENSEEGFLMEVWVELREPEAAGGAQENPQVGA